jgi:hypothetical protein
MPIFPRKKVCIKLTKIWVVRTLGYFSDKTSGHTGCKLSNKDEFINWAHLIYVCR